MGRTKQVTSFLQVPGAYLSTKTECGYLNGWIKKRSHMCKNFNQNGVNPRDIAGGRQNLRRRRSSPLDTSFLSTASFIFLPSVVLVSSVFLLCFPLLSLTRTIMGSLNVTTCTMTRYLHKTLQHCVACSVLAGEWTRMIRC